VQDLLARFSAPTGLQPDALFCTEALFSMKTVLLLAVVGFFIGGLVITFLLLPLLS